MKSLYLVLLLLLVYYFNAYSQERIFFPNLTHALIDTGYKAHFSYDKETCKLINKSCHVLDEASPYYCPDSIDVTGILVARYKNAGMKDTLDILFSSGWSDDPGYSIFNKQGKGVGGFSAIDFYITSSGTIYTTGHVNNMYNHRRKFQLSGDTVTEVKQPYCYVGMKGKIKKEVTLYSGKEGNGIVAQLPKGYEIEILLAESNTESFDTDRLFLVRTDFGLVGWLRLNDSDDSAGALMDGLYYAGD